VAALREKSGEPVAPLPLAEGFPHPRRAGLREPGCGISCCERSLSNYDHAALRRRVG